MNGKQVVEKIGITYPQLRYFTRCIDAITKKSTSQGHDHEYSERDLVYLKIAAVMRDDGMRLSEINQAITEVDKNWGDKGSLVRTGDDLIPWGWWSKSGNWIDGNKRVTRLPRIMYDVTFYAGELRDEKQLELLPEEMAVNNEP